MKKILFSFFLTIFATTLYAYDQPWSHGPLCIADSTLSPGQPGAYFAHRDGTPFFWLADTGWLLPEKLDRSEAAFYLRSAADAGFNVVQVQTINGVPAFNAYGEMSHPFGWDLSRVDREGVYGYWDHLDFIVDTAQTYGVYIGMVCIWGGLVKHGAMDEEQARVYGRFLAERYKDKPNIVWIIGGDIRGNVKPEVWDALAQSIREVDGNHLMTFHPFGRTCSATWWHNAPWLDFNMFQSGHRAYDQIKGDGDDNAQAATAEDNWRYVEYAISCRPRKPVIDGEPSYEDIPHGLHDPSQPRWTAADARRYAYWSVFAGAAGHTYGHNSIMQMKKPGHAGAYDAGKPWYEALGDDGFNQMQHLKNLIMTFPFFERVPDQSVIVGENGYRYGRDIATRGRDYMLIYSYLGQPVEVDLSKIEGEHKKIFRYCPRTGIAEYLETVADGVYTFRPSEELSHDASTSDSVAAVSNSSSDCVYIAFDAARSYLPAY